jgi:hypothetical protein
MGRETSEEELRGVDVCCMELLVSAIQNSGAMGRAVQLAPAWILFFVSCLARL